MVSAGIIANGSAIGKARHCTREARAATASMNDAQYLEHCRGLYSSFADHLTQQSQHLPENDPLRELAAGFSRLERGDGDIYRESPPLIARLFTTYPELAPAFPRQLLWFFGGDCLHYMPDEEIERFQLLEDERLSAAERGETFDLKSARAKLLNLQ